jgi:hypothetical protein
MNYFKLRYINKLDNIIIDTIFWLMKKSIKYPEYKESMEWLAVWNMTEKKPRFDKIKNYLINSTDKKKIKELNKGYMQGYLDYFKVVRKDKEKKEEYKMEEYFNVILQIPCELKYFIGIED